MLGLIKYFKFEYIKGYEKDYKIFMDGTIISCKHKLPIELKTHMTNGYKCVSLHKNNKMKTYKIHRLIALHFIPNPDNLPTIDHIDGIKTNNLITNLRWASYTTNLLNRKNFGKYKRGVYLNKKNNKFFSMYYCLKLKKNIFLGVFQNEDEAHKKYLEVYIKERGSMPCNRV